MKLWDIKEVLDKYSILESRVYKVVKDVYDEYVSSINSIELDENGNLHVSYCYTCHGCSDNDYCFFPASWLEEGFDYKAAWWKANEEAKAKAEEEAKKQAKKEAAELERKERAELARLKAKYPGA